MADAAPCGAQDARGLRIEIVYALAGEQVLVEMEVQEGTTVWQAIERSGILQRFPEIDPVRTPIGVFGRVTAHDTGLKDGDRVEIYRPLLADPKEGRRKRARPAKAPSGR